MTASGPSGGVFTHGQLLPTRGRRPEVWAVSPYDPAASLWVDKGLRRKPPDHRQCTAALHDVSTNRCSFDVAITALHHRRNAERAEALGVHGLAGCGGAAPLKMAQRPL